VVLFPAFRYCFPVQTENRISSTVPPSRRPGISFLPLGVKLMPRSHAGVSHDLPPPTFFRHLFPPPYAEESPRWRARWPLRVLSLLSYLILTVSISSLKGGEWLMRDCPPYPSPKTSSSPLWWHYMRLSAIPQLSRKQFNRRLVSGILNAFSFPFFPIDLAQSDDKPFIPSFFF